MDPVDRYREEQSDPYIYLYKVDFVLRSKSTEHRVGLLLTGHQNFYLMALKYDEKQRLSLHDRRKKLITECSHSSALQRFLFLCFSN